MKRLNLKIGGVGEMLTREQMKKVIGGEYAGGGSYQCCPLVSSNVSCSDCVNVPSGSTASCSHGGTLTKCN